MQLVHSSQHQKCQVSGPLGQRALWTVDLKLTHLDWNPEATLIHFQGQYLTMCALDYNILQGEIQSTPKTRTLVGIGEFCLVEDQTSAHWYRGRVQSRREGLCDVFLIDHGNVLTVDTTHISSCSSDLFILPPKVVCGFLSNVLLRHGCSYSVVEEYFSSLIGKSITGYIQALLPHKVLLLEAPDINSDLVRHGFGKHVDTDTFLLLVEMLTEVPLKQNIDPVPDVLIEKQRGREYSFKSSGLHGYGEILSYGRPMLHCVTRAKVRVTAALNPGLFYCQLASMEADIWEMSNKLAAVFEYRIKDQHHRTPENLGLLCSAKGKDGRWYRGFVQFLPVESQVRVLFIDYGFFECVKVDNIHRLPPEFYSVPVMAFQCSLSALTKHDEAAKNKQLSFLKTGLLGGVLDVEISGFDKEKHLYSITVVGAQENHVNEPEPTQESSGMEAETFFETDRSSRQSGVLYYETVMGQALDKAMEEEEVQVDSVFVGYVEHVQSPDNFWIRTQKRNDEFEEMMTKMADHFSHVTLEDEVLLKPELGMLCCAVYEKDMHFYRGVVTDFFEYGAKVLFIDFGNTEKVPHALIKKIPDVFAGKSAFAFCCTLVNVIPSDEVWTSLTSDFFRQAVSDKAMLVHVVQMRKNKFVVDLHEMGTDNSQSISELLISSKQAEPWNNILVEPVMQHKKDVCGKRYSVTSWTSDDTLWKDYAQEEDIDRSDAELDQVPAGFKALSIKPGCEFAVRCSYVNSPSDFWCQRLDKAPALEQLMSKLQQYYTTHRVPVQYGDLHCVAKSPQDGRWYRALIVERQRGQAKVRLVDYGFTIDIKEHYLQKINVEHVDLEGQAFRCSLYNLIEPVETSSSLEWDSKICNCLRKFSKDSGGCLNCKIVSQFNMESKELYNVVDLYNTQTQQSLLNMLVEQGLARRVTLSTKHGSADFPESFVYSSFDMALQSEEEVYVTHISSKWEIHCQLERNMEVIEELEKKISEESEKKKQASLRAVVRKLCLAKYLDGKWYRGLVHPVQSPLHLSVFFVDYGNTCISEKSHVMFIPRDSDHLLYTPMQAVRFNLASVSKEELYVDVKEWLEGAVLNKLVRAIVVGKSQDGSFDVELFVGDVNINEKVKELILSLAPKPKTVVTFNSKSHKTEYKSRTRKNETPVKHYTLRSRTPARSRPIKTVKVVESCVDVKAPVTKTKGKCQTELHPCRSSVTMKLRKNLQAKPQRQQCNTKTEQQQHTEEAKIPHLSCLPDIKISAGHRAECFVSHINSVHSFFLQLSADESAILKMVEDLSSSVLRDSLKAPSSLKINSLALAQYVEDEALYRAVVRDCEGGSCFKVEFLDYGNLAVVEKEKIYSLPKEYLSQPRFSIPCSLLDTSIYDNDASFSDAIMEKPLMVNFVHQRGTSWEVKVEILDEAVGPALTLEPASETNAEAKKQEEAPAGPSKNLENLKSCEQTPVKAGKDKKTKSETVDTSKSSKSECGDAVSRATIRAYDKAVGVVLSVLSTGCFYVRLNKTTDLCASLESCIADNLDSCESVAAEDVKPGLKCLVTAHKDNKWSRAIVQHVDQDKCQILLVDDGLTEEISSSCIRQQTSDMTNVPYLAVLCKMNCLGFSGVEHAHKLWCKTLKPMIGKEVKVLFVCYSEVEDLWQVEIVINGLFLINQIPTSVQQNGEFVLSSEETRLEAAEGELTLDPSHQHLAYAPIRIDEAYCGFAAAVTTPSEFCVTLEESLLIMGQRSMILDDLQGELSPLPDAHLNPGTLCMFNPDTKNKWCRAEIVHADTAIVLNLVDYGHSESVPYRNRLKLKKIPKELTKLPKVTYPCILRGVKPLGLDGRWTDEGAVFFQQCLCQKNLQVFFREAVSNTHWKVDILVDGVHVAKKLVDGGHAGYVDVTLGIRFQGST